MWSDIIVGHSNYNAATFRAQFKVSCATGYYGSDCNSISTTSTTTTTTTTTTAPINTGTTTTTTTTTGTKPITTATTNPTSGTTAAPLTRTNYVPIIAGVVGAAVVLVCLTIVISFTCFCYFKKSTDRERAMESIGKCKLTRVTLTLPLLSIIAMQAAVQVNCEFENPPFTRPWFMPLDHAA